MADLYPIGSIQQRVGELDATVRPWIMTDHGWRLCNGLFYNRQTYPRLWDAMPDRRRDDTVQVPDFSPSGQLYGRVERPTPLHELRDNAKFDPYFMQRRSQGYMAGYDPQLDQWKPQQLYKNVRLNREDVLGTVESVSDTPSGIEVKMQLNDIFTREIKKAMVDADALRLALGLDPFGIQSDAGIFPEITAPRGGLKFGSSNNKENSMTVKLKTPSETIERKDLTVALDLMGTRNRDHLLNAIALVQDLADNETLHRARNYSDDGVSFVNSYLRVPGTKIAGVCTDVKGSTYVDEGVQFVIDGKLEKLGAEDYVIVKLDGPEPIGNDTLALVRD